MQLALQPGCFQSRLNGSEGVGVEVEGGRLHGKHANEFTCSESHQTQWHCQEFIRSLCIHGGCRCSYEVHRGGGEEG